jgi:hypothetical protein
MIGMMNGSRDSQVRRGGASKISGQQDRAEHRGARNHIQGCTHELDDPEAERKARRVPQVAESLHDWGRLHHFHDAAEEQHQHRQGA